MLELNLKENITGALIKSVAEMANSRICGFIIYNQKHANVAKVLRDADYWAEFDAISGANWPIFCVRPLKEQHDGSDHWVSMMIATDNAPKINQQILDYFGLNDSDQDLPCFVLFAWDDNDSLCMNAYKIDFETIEQTHTSLRQIITAISKAESDILPEYKSSTSVFRNASQEIDALQTREKFHKFIENASFWLNPVRGFIKFLSNGTTL